MFENNKKHCEIDPDKICDHCGECEFCDLNPAKICDNCGKCVNMPDDAIIKIEKIETTGQGSIS